MNSRTRTRRTALVSFAAAVAVSSRLATNALLENGEGDGGGSGERTNEILRLNTSGGVAPSGTCEDGKRAAVPYGADYVFLGR